MKKLFIIVSAVVLCFAFTASAMAKVTLSGKITTVLYYHSQDDDRIDACVNEVPATPCGSGGLSETNIHMPQTGNQVKVDYSNDDKTLKGHIQIRGGGKDGGNGLDYKFAWIDYKLTDSVNFRVGRQGQKFAAYTPGAAGVGFHDGYTIFVNYGNIQVTDGDALLFYGKVNDNVKWNLYLEDPSHDGAEAPSGADAKAAASGAQFAPEVFEQNTIPRIDFSLPMTIGKLSLEPAVTYLTQNYENVAAGFDDSVDIWGISVGAKIGLGALTLSTEIIHGENLGDDSYTGAGGTPGFSAPGAIARLVDTTGDGTDNGISDATMTGGWVQAVYKIDSKLSFRVGVGMESIESDGSGLASIGVADDIDTTRYALGVSLPYKPTKGLTISPTIVYHDRDDGAQDGTVRTDNPTVNYGTESLVGVSFALAF